MCDRILAKWAAACATLPILFLGSLPAQESPRPEESFEVEPPLLVLPGDANGDSKDPGTSRPTVGQLAEQLERAKKSAATAARLVRMGALAQAEAEQRELRALRLAAELANARLVAAKEQAIRQQTSGEAGQASKAEIDSSLAEASAVAQVAEETYRKALLEAAVLNVTRQRRLLALGSARKSDVARAEEKLATLQREQTAR